MNVSFVSSPLVGEDCTDWGHRLQVFGDIVYTFFGSVVELVWSIEAIL